MAKSRTLRKAGAVVLSLAMAASTLLIAPDAAAATKVKPSKTKVTFTAKGGTQKITVKNVAKKNVKSLTVKSNKTSVATVKKNSNVKYTITAKKNKTESNKKATITGKVVLKKLKYSGKTYSKKKWTLKTVVTLKAAEVTPTTAPTEEPVAVEVKLVNESGAQSDGTAIATDNIKLSYGSALGNPSSITWYKDGSVYCVKTVNNGSIKNDDLYLDTAVSQGTVGDPGYTVDAIPTGTWYAEIRDSEVIPNVYTTNKVVVGAELPAVLSGYSLQDDYTTTTAQNVDLATNDKLAVATVTLNKDYQGSFYFFKADTEKLIDGNKADTEVNTLTTIVAGTNDKNTTAAAVADVQKKVNADKTVTYMFNPAAINGLVRGTAYKVVFVQTAIDDSKLNATTDGPKAPITIDPFTMPYVTAPASFELTGIEGDDDAIGELRGADGKPLEWLFNDETAQTYKGYTTNYNSVSDSDTETALTATMVKGVVGLNATDAFANKYSYAKVTLAKGVFGPEDVTLTTGKLEHAGVAMTGLALSEDSKDPSAATVTITGGDENATGTVYIIRGEVKRKATESVAGADMIATEIAAKGKDKAIASAKVSGIDKSPFEVTIPNVFTKDMTTDPDTTQAADATEAASRPDIGTLNNDFVVIFVPDDTTKFLGETSAIFPLVQKFTKYAPVADKDIVTAPVDPGHASKYLREGLVITGKDQFGETLTTGLAGEFELTNSAENKNDKVTLTIAANGRVKLNSTGAVVGDTYSYTTSSGVKLSVKVKVANAALDADTDNNANATITDGNGTLTIS